MSFILFGLSCRRAPILYLQVRYRFSVFVEDSEASAAAAAAANLGEALVEGAPDSRAAPA